MISLSKFLPIFVSFSFFFSLSYAIASDMPSEQEIVKKSTQEIDELLIHFNNQVPHFKTKLSTARGVILCPELTKSSALFSRTSEGECVLLGRDAQNGWTAPAFYHLVDDGIDFDKTTIKQGHNKVVIFIVTQKALEAFIDQNVSLKKNKTLSILSIKKNNLVLRTPDLYIAQFSHKGLQDITVPNMKISFDDLTNKKYYNLAVSPMDILLSMKVNNPDADDLRRRLMKFF